jgi:hypothetical protein
MKLEPSTDILPPEREMELFKQFINQNKDKILFQNEQMTDHQIDTEKVKTYLSYYQDRNTQQLLGEIIGKINYVSFDLFLKKIKEMCDIYMREKTKDDIYILLLTSLSTYTTDDRRYYKSTIWISYLVALLHNDLFDYVFDKVNLQYASLERITQLFSDQYKSINLSGKKVTFFFCDDCSYSGLQLFNVIDNTNDLINMLVGYTEQYIGQTINKDYRQNLEGCQFRFSLIVPYIIAFKQNNNWLTEGTPKSLYLPSEIIKLINNNRKEVSILSDILIKNTTVMNIIEDSDPVVYRTLIGWHYYPLIYFQFRSPDNKSVPIYMFSGGLLSEKLTEKGKEIEKYPFVRNCEKKYLECPSGLYANIQYTYNGSPIDQYLKKTEIRWFRLFDVINQLSKIKPSTTNEDPKRQTPQSSSAPLAPAPTPAPSSSAQPPPMASLGHKNEPTKSILDQKGGSRYYDYNRLKEMYIRLKTNY